MQLVFYPAAISIIEIMYMYSDMDLESQKEYALFPNIAKKKYNIIILYGVYDNKKILQCSHPEVMQAL